MQDFFLNCSFSFFTQLLPSLFDNPASEPISFKHRLASTPMAMAIFSHASDMALRMAMFISQFVGLLVCRPLWSRLKYLNNFWMNCHEILCRHARFPEDYWLWWAPDFSSSVTGLLVILSWVSQQQQINCHELWAAFVQYFDLWPDTFKTNDILISLIWTLYLVPVIQVKKIVR